MKNLKLYYFDFHGGRGEPIRIALHAAGLAFDDVRWSFQEFGENRQKLRFTAVPALEIDGQLFTQSNAISRYVGKLCNLYPEDALHAMHCDEALEALEDINHYLVQTFSLKDEELKLARQALLEGRLKTFLVGLSELLTRGGGQYFAGNALSIADLKMYVQLKHLMSGNLDHIPADTVQELTPTFVDYCQKIDNEKIVRAYYDSLDS